MSVSKHQRDHRLAKCLSCGDVRMLGRRPVCALADVASTNRAHARFAARITDPDGKCPRGLWRECDHLSQACPAVIVTCHGEYLGMLRECLASIDRQDMPGDRILCLDGCDSPAWVGQHWRRVSGSWRNPNGGRNAGLAETNAEWVVHFDADNVMPDGFLRRYTDAAAASNRAVAILYPDIQYVSEDLTPTSLWNTPEFDRLEMARWNFIDTSACWRREAVLAAGGWKSEHGLDDWTLAMRLCRGGWTARKCHGQVVIMRQHALPRRSERLSANIIDRTAHKWEVYTFGIVTLLAPGRADTHDRWLSWLREAQLPPHVKLTVVDDRIDENSRLVRKALAARDWDGVEILRSRERCKGQDWWSIHRHVASLYRMAIPCPTTDLVLFLEDDVEPPVDALPRLFDAFSEEHVRVGACAACYLARSCPGRDGQRVAVSYLADRWGDMPVPAAVPRERHSVGMVPGGCTLVGSWALASSIPFGVSTADDGSPLGWDGTMCRAIRNRGYEITLDGRVWCRHYATGADRLG